MFGYWSGGPIVSGAATLMRRNKETIMSTSEHSDTLIDLGAASVETQGLPEQKVDFTVQGIPAGMSNED